MGYLIGGLLLAIFLSNRNLEPDEKSELGRQFIEASRRGDKDRCREIARKIVEKEERMT